MIPRKYNGEYLRGRKCRTVRTIRNGAGDGVTENTICTIRAVTPGSGFTIFTDPCPVCGQQAYISHVSREDLVLADESNPLEHAKMLLDARRKAVEKLLNACSVLDNYCTTQFGIDPFQESACLGTDFRIVTEMDGSYDATLAAILASMEKNNGKNTD